MYHDSDNVGQHSHMEDKFMSALSVSFNTGTALRQDAQHTDSPNHQCPDITRPRTGAIANSCGFRDSEDGRPSDGSGESAPNFPPADFSPGQTDAQRTASLPLVAYFICKEVDNHHDFDLLSFEVSAIHDFHPNCWMTRTSLEQQSHHGHG